MKTVLITGGSRGIGKATAEEFLNRGYNVIVTSTSGESIFENTYQLDLSDGASISDFVSILQKDKVKIDILINNAGVVVEGESYVVIDSLRKTLEVNLIGTIDLTNQLLPVLIKDGVIVNVSSQMSSLKNASYFDYPSYRISKTALNMFTKVYSMHADLLKKNIRVYSFDPGWVKTDMGGPHAQREPEEPAKDMVDLVESNSESGLFYRGTEIKEW